MLLVQMRVLNLLLRQQLKMLHHVTQWLARTFARQEMKLVQMQVQLMEQVLPAAYIQEWLGWLVLPAAYFQEWLALLVFAV
jgi:hypothetical protein